MNCINVVVTILVVGFLNKWVEILSKKDGGNALGA